MSSALTRPAASPGLTTSAVAKDASRGSIRCSLRSSRRLGSGLDLGARTRLAPFGDEVAQRRHQPLGLFLAVRERYERDDAAVVDELHVDRALLAQPVIGLVPR